MSTRVMVAFWEKPCLARFIPGLRSGRRNDKSIPDQKNTELQIRTSIIIITRTGALDHLSLVVAHSDAPDVQAAEEALEIGQVLQEAAQTERLRTAARLAAGQLESGELHVQQLGHLGDRLLSLADRVRVQQRHAQPLPQQAPPERRHAAIDEAEQRAFAAVAKRA